MDAKVFLDDLPIESSVEIRRFGETNPPPEHLLPQICEFYRNNIPVHEDVSQVERDKLLTFRSSPNSLLELYKRTPVVYMAFDGEKLVGLVECRASTKSPIKTTSILWFMVDPAYRDRGIGKLLHTTYETEFVSDIKRQTQGEIYQVLAVDSRMPARKIYSKWGYELDDLKFEDPNIVSMKKKAC